VDKRNVVDASISSPPLPHFSGSERELIKAPHLFFLRLTQTYGDIVQYRHAPEPAILLNHPDYAQHVLVTNGRN